MRSMLLPPVLAGALTMPCWLFVACSPKDRLYDEPGGSGGSSSGTMSPTNATGEGGGGQSSFQDKGSCSDVGLPFDIWNAKELGDDVIGDKIILVPDPGNGLRPQVHVLVENRTRSAAMVRTLFNEENPVHGNVQWGSPDAPFHLSDAWVEGDKLVAWGHVGNLQPSIVKIVSPVDPNNGVGPATSSFTFIIPDDCTKSSMGQQYIGDIAFAHVGDDVRYIVSCRRHDQTMTVYAVEPQAQKVTYIGSGKETDWIAHPQLYSYTNGTHLVLFGDDGGRTFFSQGKTEEALGMLTELELASNAALSTIVFSLVPLPKSDGVAMLAASLDPDKAMGDLWAGALQTSDYPALAQVPPPGLKLLRKGLKFSEAGSLFRATYDETSIVVAGPSLSRHGVYLSWLERDAAPILLEREVYALSAVNIIGAAAAPIGKLNKMVVWVEQDGASPPHYRVRGKNMLCTRGS